MAESSSGKGLSETASQRTSGAESLSGQDQDVECLLRGGSRRARCEIEKKTDLGGKNSSKLQTGARSLGFALRDLRRHPNARGEKLAKVFRRGKINFMMKGIGGGERMKNLVEGSDFSRRDLN